MHKKTRISFLALVPIAFTILATSSCDRSDPGTRQAIRVAREVISSTEKIQIYDRMLAAGALALEDIPEGKKILVEALASPSRIERRAAMSNLLSAGDKQVFEITSKDKDADFDLDLLEALRTAPSEDAEDFLRRKLFDSERHSLTQTLDAILIGQHQGLIEEVESLQTLSTGPLTNGLDRQYAMIVGASLGSTKAIEEAKPLLRSPRGGERERGAAALGFASRDHEEIEKLLLRLRNDPQPGVSIAAWSSLSRLGNTEATDRLVEALLSMDDRRAPLAAGALKRASAKAVLDVAKQVVGSETIHFLVLGRVIEAVGWAHSISALTVLERALQRDQDEHVRLQALWAIGWRARPEELQLALVHLKDPELPIRTMAAWAYLYAKKGRAPKDTGLVAQIVTFPEEAHAQSGTVDQDDLAD